MMCEKYFNENNGLYGGLSPVWSRLVSCGAESRTHNPLVVGGEISSCRGIFRSPESAPPESKDNRPAYFFYRGHQGLNCKLLAIRTPLCSKCCRSRSRVVLTVAATSRSLRCDTRRCVAGRS